MQIIPVLDILNGVVVRGIAGQREHYRPVRSLLTDSIDPSVLLHLFADQFGLTKVYVADLDAIQGRHLNRCVLAELTQSASSLIVDRGVRSEDDLEELLDLGVQHVVVALETLPDIDLATRLLALAGPERLTLSLDLKGGRPVSINEHWSGSEPAQVATELYHIGYTSMIILDVASVGISGGISTLDLCRQLKKSLPLVNLVTGGGVRSMADLHVARQAGADGLLVASALHDRNLTADDVSEFRRTNSS